MTIDITSFFFNSSIEGATATAAWGTSIGQNQSKACRIEDEKPGVLELVTGMLYKSISDTKRIDISAGSNNRELLLASVFEKVFVNGAHIKNASFLLLLVRENTESHSGRLLISYPPYALFDGKSINSDCIKQMANTLGCTEKGCWFVHDISVRNQDELHFAAVVVDAEKPKIYKGKSKDRSREWAGLVQVQRRYSLQELGTLLKEMYENAEPGKQVAMVYIFAFTYGEQIIYDYKPSDIISAAGLKSELSKDLDKAYDIYRFALKKRLQLFTYKGLPSNSGLSSIPLQTIYYGCPGSGKSHEVNVIAEGKNKEKLIWYKKTTETDKSCPRVPNPSTEEQKKLTNNVFRTAFHPDYDYATFVGCYKPVKDNGALDYKFVPQVFTNAYVCALRHPEDPVYLIIEEINRGNCAQIFGDLFQLLDRKDRVSEYPIKPDTELAKYLDGEEVPSEELSLPANLNIIATMNTSDQSLFPMDSAFKRRWAMVYKPIDYTHKKASSFKIHIGDETYPWIGFLKMVNDRILDATDSEDKQMGEFFIKGDDTGNISEDDFKNKVMFYIWNDVCKDHYTARRPNGKFFLRLANPLEGEKDYFTFVDLFDKERNKDSRLLKEFIAYLEKKYLEEHTSAPIDENTKLIDWVKHLSLPTPDDSGNE